MDKPGKLSSLKSGNGTVVEVSYQVRNIDYNIEDDERNYPSLFNAKKDYLETLVDFEEYLNDDTNLGEQSILDNYQKDLNIKYNKYILELIKAQEEEQKAEGLI